MSDLPYFDIIFNSVYDPTSRIAKVFGKHVHWGYWKNTQDPDLSDTGCIEALDALSIKMLELVGVKNGDTIADVGCGLGGTTSILNQHHTDLSIHAVNIDARQIAYAKEKVGSEVNESNSITFYENDACKMDLPDSHFDVVIAVECIFHFDSKEKFLKEALRILKPGGKLVISDFITDDTRKLRFLLTFIRHRAKFKRVFGNTSKPRYPGTHRKLAEEAGYVFETELDVTENTIPTYAMLHSAAEEFGALKKDVQQVLQIFESLARKRLSQYWLYVFSKPSE